MEYSIKKGEVVTRGEFPTTRKGAIRESIRKWEFIVNAIEEGKPAPDSYADFCALCNLYYGNMCAGCPVSEATGDAYCSSSPHEWYTFNARDWRTKLAAAVAEVEFLQTLE